jgi:hypothetical protein
MRPFRTALVYILVAAALGAYVWFFERKPVEEAAQKKERLFEFAADDVRTLVFAEPGAARKEDRAPLVLRKGEAGAWSIVEPAAYDADANEVRNLITNLVDPGVEERIESPGNLAEFGLREPGAWVAVGLADGKTATLFVGSKTINEQSVYLKTHDRPTVYMAGVQIANTFRRKVDDLRDKVVFATGFAEARRVVLSRPGRDPVVLEKKDETWRVRTPSGAWVTADEDETRQVLNVVNGIRVREFFDRPELSRMGLGERNRGILEIWPSEKRPSVTLVMGNRTMGPNNEARVFLRRKDKPFAVSVVDNFDRDTDKRWSDFRDRNVMRFESSDATRLVISKPGASLTYERNPEGVWTCPGRGQANDEAARIVDALASSRIQSFPEGVTPSTAGTLRPFLSAEVALPEGARKVYRFGHRQGERILLSPGEGPDVYLIQPNAANLIENVLTGITTAPTTAR